MTSKTMRNNPLFMRNNFACAGKWDIPLVKKQNIDTNNISLIACSDTKANDKAINKIHGVHFFVDDYRFSGIYNNPERSLARYSQYKFLLTPDFSTYADMNLWRQLESVAKSRWIGAYWQNKKLIVIPTVTWSDSRSYEFCFDGIEIGSTVAVGMIGCKHSRINFIRGYTEMLNRLQPKNIIVFGKPFSEMEGNIIEIDYLSTKKGVR